MSEAVTLGVHAATALSMWLEGMGIPGIPGAAPMAAQAQLITEGRSSYALACTIGVLSNWGGSLAGYWMISSGRRRIKRRPPRTGRSGKSPRKRASRQLRLAAVALRRILRWGILGPAWARGILIALSRSVGSLRTPVTLAAGMNGWPAGHWTFWTFLGSALHVLPWQWIIYTGLRASQA